MMTLANGVWSFLTDTTFLHNTILAWIGLLAVLLVSFLVGKTGSYILTAWAKRLQDGKRMALLQVLLRSAATPFALLVFAVALYVAQSFLVLDWGRILVTPDGTRQVLEVRPEAPAEGAEAEGVAPAVPVERPETRGVIMDGPIREGPIREFWIHLAQTIGALAVTWFLFRLVDVIELMLNRWTARTHTKLDDQLVPMVRKSVRAFVVIVAGLFIAQNIFEWNIGALVAGLGLGGLALALAAQESLSNLFGSLVILTDRPFTLGELVIIQGYRGTVEDVGFRSTRVRTLEGHLVTIPNSVVSKEVVENPGRRPFIRRAMNVTITYDTPPEKVDRAVAILREMVAARMEHFHAEFPPRVFFNDFNAASLNLLVFYYFVPADWWTFIEFNHEFNRELLQRFNEEGIEFAFPTQTLYVRPDGPLEARLIQSSPDGQ